jgi:hypothetical protein
VPNLGIKKYGVICCDLLRLGGERCCRCPFRIHIWILRQRSISKFDFNLFSDVSLLKPMFMAMAKNDSEIGERMGICHSFTGT